MRSQKAFTLVEILIVVLILAVLAAIVLPRFTNASALARANMLADDLRVLRTQFLVYKSQHRDVPPGHPGGDPTVDADEATLVAQLTMGTNASGATAAAGTPGFPYGPYLREMPPNPVNGKSTVEIIGSAAAFPAAGDDSHGYIYQPSTMLLKADSPGTDENGKLYFNY